MKLLVFTLLCLLSRGRGEGDGRRLRSADVCGDASAHVVFVVATGRSGSTSLFNLLREYPQSDFLGENGGVAERLYLVDFDLTRSRHLTLREGGVENRGAWVYNDVQRQDVLAVTRELLWTHVGWRPGARLIGFKEVRWQFHRSLADVDWLLDLFPCAKVLLSYRTDIEVQAKSGFWARRNKNQTKVWLEIATANDAIFALHSRQPNRTRLAPLDSLQSVESLQAHMDWAGLGMTPEGEGCRVTGVPWANALGGLDRHIKDLCSIESGCTPDPDYRRRYLNCTMPTV